MTGLSMRERLPENLFLALILAWGIYVLIAASGYESVLAWTFPVLVAVPLVVLCALKIAFNATESEVLGRLMFFDIERGEKPGSIREATVFAATIGIYLLIVSVLNFFLAMPIFLFAFFKGFDVYSTKKCLVVSVAIWLFICFVFGSLFNVSGVFLGPFSEFDLGLFG